jgi:sugar/nucleoside kinase (ribokinase family)
MLEPFLSVYGHICLDQIMSLERFPEPNTSVDILEKHRYFGGTGANLATMAASLGVPTALCSFVGNDLPEDFRRFMEGRGVDLRDTVPVNGYETSTVLIVSDSAHNQIAYVYQGPMRDMGSFELRMDVARRSKVIHVSTGRPEYYLRLMKECRALGKEIVFDPAQEIHLIWSEEAFRKAAPLCDMLFCNENELRTAMRYLGAERPEEMLSHIPVLVTTQGAKGSIVYTAEGSWRIPAAKPKRMVDPTGAGDAFRAGFYAGKFRGGNILKWAAYGSATASFVLEEKGSLTNIPTWDEVEERAGPILGML